MTNNSAKPSRKSLLFLSYLSFIILGMPIGLLGVAWPTMRVELGQSLDAMGVLLFASTAGYILSSFFISRLISRFGIGSLLVFSSLGSAAGLFGYTISPMWGLIVASGFLLGFAGGVMDAGLNTYLASEYNESEMQWLHASFGLGAMFSPLVMTGSLSWFNAWRPGYIFVGALTATMGVAFIFTRSLWKTPKKEVEIHASGGDRSLMDYQTSLWNSLRHPMVWVGILMFLFYCGAEFTLGNWTYTLLVEGRGVAPAIAGLWAGGFWATFTFGRAMGALFAHRFKLQTLLTAAMSLALVGNLLFWWNPTPMVGVAGVFVSGFALAPIFAGLISSTARRVGAHHAANTIGIQMAAANLGGALLPALAGYLAQRMSLETIPALLAVTLLVLLTLFLITSRGSSTLLKGAVDNH